MKQSFKVPQPAAPPHPGSVSSLPDSPVSREGGLGVDSARNVYNGPPEYKPPRFLLAALIIGLVTVAMYLVTSHIVNSRRIKDPMVLTWAEKKSAIALIEENEDLGFKRMKMEAEINAEQSEIGIRRQKLFLEIQQNHHLDPDSHYVINEYQGTITKQQ